LKDLATFELKCPAEALREFETSHLHESDRFRGLYGAARARTFLAPNL
jgi:hypothetical protein